jgi:hypothetical protein
MALSENQISTAKNEALQYLEYSSYMLCLMLGINPENIDEEIDIGIPELNSYASDTVPQLESALNCLKKQLSIIDGIR